MDAAGFEDVDVVDVSERFVETARAWHDAFAAREPELRRVLGNEYDERQEGRRQMIAGIREGLLQRLLVSAAAYPR